MTGLRTISTLNPRGKRILVRLDLNVPLEDGQIRDDTRIQAVLPTIIALLEGGCKVLILMSHLGRPKGKKDKNLSLYPVAERMTSLLGKKVIMSDDILGMQVLRMVDKASEGTVILLENLRFDKREESNDPSMAKELAALADCYVNDAFGTAHRAHASTVGVTKYLPSYAGFLLEKEVRFLDKVLSHSGELIVVIGGAKVSSKINVLEFLLPRCQKMIIGGGMAYTFLRAQGISIGDSIFEPDHVSDAASLLEQARKCGVDIFLPRDHMVASRYSETEKGEYVETISDGKMALDIGKKTITEFTDICRKATGTIMWNGPMGVFEFSSFQRGTREVAQAIADSKAMSIVGGGDSVAAISMFGMNNKFTHISTGGGASLEYLEGKELPGIAKLRRNK